MIGRAHALRFPIGERIKRSTYGSDHRRRYRDGRRRRRSGGGARPFLSVIVVVVTYFFNVRGNLIVFRTGLAAAPVLSDHNLAVVVTVVTIAVVPRLVHRSRRLVAPPERRGGVQQTGEPRPAVHGARREEEAGPDHGRRRVREDGAYLPPMVTRSCPGKSAAWQGPAPCSAELVPPVSSFSRTRLPKSDRRPGGTSSGHRRQRRDGADRGEFRRTLSRPR